MCLQRRWVTCLLWVLTPAFVKEKHDKLYLALYVNQGKCWTPAQSTEETAAGGGPSLCLLFQTGPRMSDETDIQQVSSRLTPPWLRGNQQAQTGFVGWAETLWADVTSPLTLSALIKSSFWKLQLVSLLISRVQLKTRSWKCLSGGSVKVRRILLMWGTRTQLGPNNWQRARLHVLWSTLRFDM